MREHVHDGVPDEAIARLASQLWERRGCPLGSPDVDWFQAENTLLLELEERCPLCGPVTWPDSK
jgi:hypothetical protein